MPCDGANDLVAKGPAPEGSDAVANQTQIKVAIVLGAVALIALAFARFSAPVRAAAPSSTPSIVCGPTGGPTVNPSHPPSPVPAPTPVPPLRAPTATDWQQIQAMSGFTQAGIQFIEIAGNYCFFGWKSSVDPGVYLATNTSGSWRAIFVSKGSMNVRDMLSVAPAMGSGLATELLDAALAAPTPTP